MRLRAIASAPMLATLLLALVLSIVWAANSPVDDPYSTLNTVWNGTSGLAERGFVALKEDLAEGISPANATDVILVVGPARQFSRSEANSVADFARRGGLLVIVDNFGSGNGLLDLLELPVRFDGRLLVDPLFYRKQPLFPVVSDFAPSEFSRGLDELLLDYATALNVTAGSTVTVLARSSPFSFLDRNRDGEKSLGEPSEAFPILVEVPLGEGTVVLFTSPASFANGLIDEADNSVLVENIAKHESRPGLRSALLLDQTHLQNSPFTPAKLAARQLVTSVLEGRMQLSAKLGLAAIAVMLVAVRYSYKRSGGKLVEKTEGSYTAQLMDVESVLRLHPTWDRKTLEYVADELQGSMRWRRLSEGE